jgi:hypothetical protein
MNERIKELALEAGGSHYPEVNSKQLEKFAELIILECSDVLLKWKNEPFPFDEDLAVSLIKEHFGVGQ